jgi:hypothetical protein
VSDRRSRAEWLHSCMISSLAPASTGALVLRADDASSGEGPLAVATVFPPGVDFPSTEFFCRGGWAYIFRLTGWERRMRFPGLGETLSSHRRRLTRRFDGKVWYIMGAVDAPSTGPAGAPVLTATLAPITDAADEAGQACYTETSSASSRKAFESLVSRATLPWPDVVLPLPDAALPWPDVVLLLRSLAPTSELLKWHWCCIAAGLCDRRREPIPRVWRGCHHPDSRTACGRQARLRGLTGHTAPHFRLASPEQCQCACARALLACVEESVAS